jgi:hypothetical protein
MRALRKGEYEIVRGEFYGTPKELWGFRTAARSGSPRKIANEFVVANRDVLGLQPAIQDVRFQRCVESLGAYHVIFQQFYFERRVHRAYVTVHIDRGGRVYHVKCRAAPGERLPVRADFLPRVFSLRCRSGRRAASAGACRLSPSRCGSRKRSGSFPRGACVWAGAGPTPKIGSST